MKRVIDFSIFRDYDIRGTYPDQINEEIFCLLGKAISSYLKVDKIAVGRDARLSSLNLFSSLIIGILETGTDVVDLGMISTEMHYFASGYFQFPANIIVSASHNPSQYNGLKMVKKGVVPLHGKYGLPEIIKLIKEGKFAKKEIKGKVEKMNIMESWISHVLKFVDKKTLTPLKVAIDAGNGMGGLSWEKLRKDLPIEIVPLYFEPDGHFPHHLPDPSNEKNLLDLKKAIRTHQADLGMALDGDADRLFVLDENGRLISGTILSAILSQALLEKYGSSTVLYNAVCGRIVPETIKKYKGTAVRVRVGHSFIKEEMRRRKALFAGEHSGHFYFRENYNADSSTIAALIFMEYLSKTKLPVSLLVDEFNKYQTSGEINFQINSSDILEKVAKEFKDAKAQDWLDGLSVWYDNWWFSLRASKTEPLLRLNIEANNQSLLKAGIKKIEELIVFLGGVKT